MTQIQIMEKIQNLEEPKLTQTQEKIYNLLKNRSEPIRPKTIANLLNMDINSTRARLHELSKMGMVYKPVKTMKMNELNSSGKFDKSSNLKCSYTARV